MGVPYAEVIGDPIAHSKSPLIHKFWLEKLGLEGDYRRALVREGGLDAYLAGRRGDPDWRGCSVTMPHKEAVPASVPALDSDAERIGAANTIVAGETGLKAFNTDALAVSDLLRSVPRSNQESAAATCVQIIGAGGAAKAAVAGAYGAGFRRFSFYNRTVGKAREIAPWLALPSDHASPLEGLGPIGDDGLEDRRRSHIVVNASSLGMEGFPEVPIHLSDYGPDTIVLDMVYHPLETGLLRQARSLGLHTVDGLEMLVAQAAHAFALLFGEKAPREHDRALRALLTR